METFRSMCRSIYNAFHKLSVSLFRPKTVPVSSEETVCRFLFTGEFNRTSAKWQGFMPNRDLETSVFRTDRLSDAEVIHIRSKVSEARRKQCKATTYISVSDILATLLKSSTCRLNVIASERQYRWHADILNWPGTQQDRMAFSQKLAKKSFGLVRH